VEFEFAYDLKVITEKEVVMVQSVDRHRKIRICVKSISKNTAETIIFHGHSLGSSVREIKAAKKDETAVPVSVVMKLREGQWRGSVSGS